MCMCVCPNMYMSACVLTGYYSHMFNEYVCLSDDAAVVTMIPPLWW